MPCHQTINADDPHSLAVCMPFPFSQIHGDADSCYRFLYYGDAKSTGQKAFHRE